jgi:phosphohistidine phosphatase
MTRDGEIPCTVYLVQHGEAEPKTRDLQRGLASAGRETVERVAAWAASVGLAVEQIRHSGKRRAEQTAAVFTEALRPSRGQRRLAGFGAAGRR